MVLSTEVSKLAGSKSGMSSDLLLAMPPQSVRFESALDMPQSLVDGPVKVSV